MRDDSWKAVINHREDDSEHSATGNCVLLSCLQGSPLAMLVTEALT